MNMLSLLLEANVYNVKVEFNGVALNSYLEQLASHLSGDETKGMFVKKFTKLLMNDERFHAAVRELPSGSPEWAVKAVAARELVAFAPTEALNDVMMHIVHYISALEDVIAAGVNNPDNPAAVSEGKVALRELQGIPKVENLDVVSEKSNEWFKRGSKRASKGAVIEGMTEVFDAGGGFKWYVLTAEDAFVREGKTLQNCIGSMYTHAKSKREGYSILVMKKGNGETVVGARVDNATNEVAEMKGKNNKPPIDSYMPPVLAFLKARKFTLSRFAVNDFSNAGYLYDEGSKELKPVLDFVIGLGQDKVGSARGYDVYAMDWSRVTTDVRRSISGWLFSNWWALSERAYMVRKGGRIAGFCSVTRKDSETTTTATLTHVSVKGAGTVVESAASDVPVEMWRGIVEVLKITHIPPTIVREIYMHSGASFVPSKSEFIVPEHVTVSDGWLKYSRESAEAVISTFNVQLGDEVDALYVKKEDDSRMIWVVVGQDGSSVITQVRGAYATRIETVKKIKEMGAESIGALVKLVEDEDVKVPEIFEFVLGLDKSGEADADGKHSLKEVVVSYQPTQVEGAAKLQLPKEVLPNIKTMFKASQQINVNEDSDSLLMNTTWLLLARMQRGGTDSIRAATKWKSERAKTINMQTTIQPTTKVAEVLRKAYKEVYATQPTDVYRCNVTYGHGDQHKHTVYMVAAKDKVLAVDSITSFHKWRGWNDHEQVKNQLNKYLNDLGLTLAPGSLPPQEELRRDKSTGLFTTSSTVNQGQLESHKATNTDIGTDEIRLSDGYKLVALKESEQVEWERGTLQKVKSQGAGWKLINGDLVVGVLIVKNDTIVRGFINNNTYKGAPVTRDIKQCNTRKVSVEMARVLDVLKEKFNWKVNIPVKDFLVSPDFLGAAQETLKPDSPEYRRLYQALMAIQSLSTYIQTLRTIQRKKIIEKESITKCVELGLAEYRYIEWGRLPGMRVSGYLAPDEVPPQRIRDNINPQTDINAFTVILTDKGRRVFQQMLRNQEVDLSGIRNLGLEDGWTPPERKSKPKAEPAPATPTDAPAPRGDAPARRRDVPEGGTAANRALVTFRNFVADNDRMPTRREFMTILQAAPFNMSAAGAQTYYYNTKKKYGNLNERFSELARQELLVELSLLKQLSFVNFLVESL